MADEPKREPREKGLQATIDRFQAQGQKETADRKARHAQPADADKPPPPRRPD